jgi:3-oxoacyl-[acyl-carrier-protein] synthase-3
MIFSKILGTGSYLPKNIVTNDDLAKKIDTSDEWIFSRTGIRERRIADEAETTGFMASEAMKNAFLDSKIDANQIDMIIVATTTPELTLPSTACIVQGSVGAKNAVCFDIQAVCSGFVYAMTIADSFIKSGRYKNIAVIGADKNSNIVDWTDRSTCVLFGDGSGCVILSASSEAGVIDHIIESDGSKYDILCSQSGIGKDKMLGTIAMNGREVFRYATEKMGSYPAILTERNGISVDDIKLFICHQANTRIISYVYEKLGLDPAKFPITLDKHGNTSGASVPITLDYSIKNRLCKRGDYLILQAVGAGMTSGAIFLKY